MLILAPCFQFCNPQIVSILASCGRLSAIVPDLANRPRQLVFLTPIDSQLNDFLNEIHQIAFFEPSIVERIDEDLNLHAKVEREAFESPPVFNSVQRKQYFDFPTELRRLAGELRAPTHQLGFLLSAGYFKAAKSFFPPSAFQAPATPESAVAEEHSWRRESRCGD